LPQQQKSSTKQFAPTDELAGKPSQNRLRSKGPSSYFFDTHQTRELLNAPALQLDPHGQPVMGPAGAGDGVDRGRSLVIKQNPCTKCKF